nr:hypothetical protein Q903MT_gene5944 [Picea sitchensis]
MMWKSQLMSNQLTCKLHLKWEPQLGPDQDAQRDQKSKSRYSNSSIKSHHQ